MSVGVIVPAAGIGVRMKQHTPKPYLELGGKPILAHTLAIFEALPEIQEVTVVTHPANLDYCRQKVVETHGFRKVLRLVPGGKERQDSVYHALKVLHQQENLEVILVHDGVRPFVSPQQIRQVIRAAREQGAAILARPAHDTIKRVGRQHRILGTLDRREIWLAQTPQGFQTQIIWRAFVEAYGREFYGTDEASLVEQLGLPVVVVPGSALNIKITTPEDLVWAEAILAHKGKKA